MNNFLKYALIIFVNFLVLLLLLKVTDLFFVEEAPDFQFYDRHIALTEYPAEADFSILPPPSIMEQVDNLELKEYRLRTDPYGLIIGPEDIHSMEGPIDIIFFGGSTTECFFVDEDKRFPYLAGELLSQQIGEKVVTRNAGLMGKHSMKSNFDLMVRGTQLNPKIVVLMHNINDLVQLLYVDGYYDGPLSRRLIAFPDVTERNRSFIYRFGYQLKEWIFPNLYKKFTQMLSRDQMDEDEWSGWRASENSERAIDGIKVQFEKSLRTFISIARSHDMEPVLMTQFNRMDIEDEFIVQNYYLNARYGIHHEDFFQYSHEFNEVIRDTAEKEGVLLIDLAILVPSTSEYMYDAVHLNTTGSVRTSEIIAESLKSRF